MVGAWEHACGRLDQYGMRHTRAFSNLCNVGLTPAELVPAARQACPAAQPTAIFKTAPRGGSDAQLVAEV
jgi:legumain